MILKLVIHGLCHHAVLLPPGPATTPNVFFQQVPEAEVVKNRLHICLEPTGRSREEEEEEEVERLLGLGATLVADHRRSDGTGWVVLADPEGDEFLRAAQRRRACRCRPQRRRARGAADPSAPGGAGTAG